MEHSEIVRIARDVHSWLQNAVGDAADAIYSTRGFVGADKWDDEVERMKKDGVGDVHGALADNMFEDEDTMQDLAFDRIHDEAKSLDSNIVLIAIELRKLGHKPLRKAMNKLIADTRDHAGKTHPAHPIFHMLTAVDNYTKAIWGHTFTRALETECCISCGVKFGNPPPEFFIHALCSNCIPKKKGGK